MYFRQSFLALFAVLSTGTAQSAVAQITEVRVGVTEFDERTLDIGLSAGSATENSVGISGEILLA